MDISNEAAIALIEAGIGRPMTSAEKRHACRAFGDPDDIRQYVEAAQQHGRTPYEHDTHELAAYNLAPEPLK